MDVAQRQLNHQSELGEDRSGETENSDVQGVLIHTVFV